MLRIKNAQLDRNKSAVLPGIQPDNTPKEQQIFDFIRAAIQIMPQKPVVRVSGGWPRDKMMPLVRPDVIVPPPDDIDLTITNMTGMEFVDALEAYAIQVFGEGQRNVKKLNVDFETKDEQVKAIAAGQISIFGEQIDVVSLRKESWIHPETGEKLLRNPIVEKGSPWTDAARRDLTINGMSYNLNDSTMEDFVGGYDDLATMTLRTPTTPKGYPGGQPRGTSDEEWQYQEALRIFKDDPVRLLRVLRFFSRYAPAKIDQSVINAMHNEEVQQLLTDKLRSPDARGIVVEKNAKEFRKIMSGEKPAEAMRIMFQTGLLDNVLNLPPEFASLDMDQINSYHQLNLIEHTLSVIKNMNDISKQFGLSGEERMMMNMVAMAHDLGKLDPRSHKIKPGGERGYSGNMELPKDQRRAHEQSSVEVWKSFSSAFKLSNNETKFVSDVIAGHMKPHYQVDDEWLANNMP